MKLFKISAYDCRETYVISNDVADAIVKSGVNKNDVHTIRVLATEIPLNKKGAILVWETIDG